jgi:hypothetical protein
MPAVTSSEHGLSLGPGFGPVACGAAALQPPAARQPLEDSRIYAAVYGETSPRLY